MISEGLMIKIGVLAGLSLLVLWAWLNAEAKDERSRTLKYLRKLYGLSDRDLLKEFPGQGTPEEIRGKLWAKIRYLEDK